MIDGFIKWERRTPRVDLVWAVLFYGALAAWLAVSIWLLVATNIDRGFQPTGGLLRALRTCHGPVSGLPSGAAKGASSALAGRSHMWSVIAEHWELPAAALGSVVGLSYMWLLMLQWCGGVAVWTTVLLKSAVLVFLGLRLHTAGFGQASIACWAGGISIAIVAIWQYQRINLSAKLLSRVGEALRGTPSVWVASAVLLLIQLALISMLTVSAAASFYVLELTRGPHGQCSVEPSRIAYNMRIVAGALFLWCVWWFRAAQTLVVAAPTICWFYPPSRGGGPDSPALAALRWVFTSSAGTVSLSGALMALAARARDAATERRGCCGGFARCRDYCNPMNLLYRGLWYAFQSCTVVLTRFTLVAHAYTGESFFSSAKAALRTLGANKVIGGYVVDQTGENVLIMGAYVFSLVIGLVSWVYVDDLKGYDTFDMASKGAGYTALVYALVLTYLYLTYYPTLTLLLVVFVSHWLPDVLTPLLCGLFMACTSHLVFGCVAQALLCATDTAYFCYHIERRKVSQHRDQEGGAIVLLEDVKMHTIFAQLEQPPPTPSAPPEDAVEGDVVEGGSWLGSPGSDWSKAQPIKSGAEVPLIDGTGGGATRPGYYSIIGSGEAVTTDDTGVDSDGPSDAKFSSYQQQGSAF